MKHMAGMLCNLQVVLNLFRNIYHAFCLCGLHMFNTLGKKLSTVCILAVIATSNNIAKADIVYPNGHLASVGNPGVYVQRWSTTGGITPGVVSCNMPNCFVGVAAQWRNTTTHPGYYWYSPNSNVISVPLGTPWNEAIRQWVNKYGRSGTVSTPWHIKAGPLTLTCMRATGINGHLIGQIPMPETCDVILPAPAKCEFNVQSITLNHQTIDKNAVNGHTITSNLSTNCSTAANVIVNNMQGNAPIPVLPGITSTLTIDGRALGTQMYLPSGNSAHTISSTLRDTGTAYGAFSTSIVLRITIL